MSTKETLVGIKKNSVANLKHLGLLMVFWGEENNNVNIEKK